MGAPTDSCGQLPRGGKPAALTERSQLNLAQERTIPPPAQRNPVNRHPCLVILNSSLRSRVNSVKDLLVRRCFADAQHDEE
jgi:hypothetical protein